MVYKTVDASGKTKRIYLVWYGMKNRCHNPNNKDYKDYGERGITVCEDWLDFSTFCEWAYTNGYDNLADYGKCTLDRIDVNGNYEPSNCRWVDMKTQNRNTRKNIKINGKCLSEIAENAGLNKTTLQCRYYNNPDISEQELTLSTDDYTKLHNRIVINGMTLKEIAESCGLSVSTLDTRYRSGITDIETLIQAPYRGTTKILIDGMTIKEISTKYSLTERLIRSRYEKGARTLEELTRPYRQRRS